MENYVKNELVRVVSNNKYGKNSDLWREHEDELFSYFDISSTDVVNNYCTIYCSFFTENIPIGIDIYEMITNKDIFYEVDYLEEEYLDLDIAGFTVVVGLSLKGEIRSVEAMITLKSGTFFVDSLLNDVVNLNDLFIKKAMEYIESKRESNLIYLKLLIDQLVTDKNVTEEDKQKFLEQLIDRLNKLEGEK